MLSQFKRYSPFACQTIPCEFDKPPQPGQTFDMTVPRHGDLVKGMYLRFGFTPPTPIQGFTHGFVPSVHMFDKFELIIGDTVVETLFPEFINIYYNTFIDFSKKKGNTFNIGPVYSNRDVDAELPDSADSIIYDTRRTYTMFLPFYFALQASHAFPLCALTRQELVVRVHMRPIQRIVQLAEGVSSSSYESSLTAVKLTHMFVDTEYVFLGTDEFKYFLDKPQTYIYTQTQEQQIDVGTDTYRLEIYNPVAEFFLYILHNNKLEFNRTDKNEQYSTENGHSISSINLELDGQTYIDETVADSNFMSQLQYLLNHSSVFENNTTMNNMYVYNYSFSENPEACCPGGTVNFNLINNKILKVNLAPVSTSVPRTLFVLARTLNILRIQDGTAEVVFKNVS